MLGANSNKRRKVEALLEAPREAAREANRGEGFTGLGDRRIRLEVVVHAGPGEEPWDATNYLGVIADVLEGKAKKLIAPPGLLDWLGDLIKVGLYDDDRQQSTVSLANESRRSVSRFARCGATSASNVVNYRSRSLSMTGAKSFMYLSNTVMYVTPNRSRRSIRSSTIWSIVPMSSNGSASKSSTSVPVLPRGPRPLICDCW